MNKKESYFVYGIHTVMAVMRFQPERAKKLFIARKKDNEALINLATINKIPVTEIDKEKLSKLFNTTSETQGVVLLCTALTYSSLEDLIASDARLIVALDSLQDPVNLGKIARSAWCFNADAIIICKDRSVHVTSTAEKAAVGALSRIPVALVSNLSTALTKLKKEGFFIYGAYEKGDTNLYDCDFHKKTVIVIGQEEKGLRDLTKKNCDFLVNIPMSNQEACLNAADAALVFLYQFSMKKNP